MVDKIRKLHFKFLNYLFEDMYPVKSKYYPDSTFFKKDDKVTLELEKSGTLWVLYSVWTSISDMFSLDYNETQQLIKEWMEKQIKLGGVAPRYCFSECYSRMEEQLKSEEVTPKRSNEIFPAKMELQLKSVEIIPLQGCVSPFSMDGEELTPQRMDYVIIGEIEEQLKSEEVIPHTCITNQLMRVQEELESVEIKPVKDVNLICQLAELRLNREEVTPRNAIAPPFRWRKLDSVKYAEIKPTSNKFVEFRDAERRLNSEEIKPRQVVNGSFDWVEEQTKQI